MGKLLGESRYLRIRWKTQSLPHLQLPRCCIKHNREHPTTGLVTARHSAAQETPVPTYVGMMLHAHTRKRELVDRLSHLGMSISYTRVLELSAQMGNSACQQFHREQVVCPPPKDAQQCLHNAIDNIDHNPSSTTAKGSFHGTAISLLQHPCFTGEGVDRSIAIFGGSREASSKMVGRLPHYCTDMPPVTTNMKNISVPATSVVSLARDNLLGADRSGIHVARARKASHRGQHWDRREHIVVSVSS